MGIVSDRSPALALGCVLHRDVETDIDCVEAASDLKTFSCQVNVRE